MEFRYEEYISKFISILLTVAMLIASVGVLPVSGAYLNESGFNYQVENGEACIYQYTGTDTEVIIPSTIGGYPVTSLYGTFGWNSTVTKVTIPDSVTSIQPGTFNNCTNLKELVIPDSVTYIGVQAFNECTSLSSVELPEGLTNISEAAFWDCENLRRVSIPASVKIIENQAFSGCEDLSTVNYGGTKEQWDEILIGSSNECLLKASINCSDGGSNQPEDTEDPGNNDNVITMGSVDGNDTIDANDALNVLKFSAKLGDFSEEQYMAGDVDYDGYITASDALLILKYAAKLIDSF